MKLSADLITSVCAVVAAAACIAPPSAQDSPEVDEAALLLAAQSYRDSGDFVEVTTETFQSTVAADAPIRVWISSFASTPYGVIDPDLTGSEVRLPEEALIVREVYDSGGSLKKLTLMAKGPRGYNPVVGDYWFGVTDPDGTPQVDNGAVLTGRLEQCFSCHQARGEVDDFLFGVPAAARGVAPDPEDPGTPPPPPPPPPPIDPGPICGDFVCEAPESCSLCPSDCCVHDDGDDHGGDDDSGGDDSGGDDHGGGDD